MTVPTETPSYRAVAQHDGLEWSVRVFDTNGSSPGVAKAVRLDLVESRALDVLEAHAGRRPRGVVVDIQLPAAGEDALARAERLCRDATTDVDVATRELRRHGMAVADILRILDARALCAQPRALSVTNAEIAMRGLAQHPAAIALEWDDHGRFLTVTCRTCLDVRQPLYATFPPGEINVLIYAGDRQELRCDRCGEDIA